MIADSIILRGPKSDIMQEDMASMATVFMENDAFRLGHMSIHVFDSHLFYDTFITIFNDLV